MIEIIYTLIMTHITIICVTLYLHRSQAHKSIEFNIVVSHFMRFWLWLTTGMITKEWVAIHRKHHRYCEKEQDPHSPKIYGILNVVFKGVFLYVKAAKDKVMVDSYGVGTPADWMERNVYSTRPTLGIGILFLFNTWLFGWIGILIWGIQMIWIPFWAAGVVNGIGHYFGYRNGDSKDNSKNFSPIGILIGGEELHNNHHLSPGSPKLSMHWYEFDVGYFYLMILKYLGLAKVKQL